MAIHLEHVTEAPAGADVVRDLLHEVAHRHAATIDQPDEVANFLLAHAQVANSLLTVMQQLRDELEASIEMALFVDRPTDSDAMYLVLRIRCSEYSGHLLDVMRDATSAVLALNPADPHFLVTSDFVAAG